jgi:hypothetical protein
MKSPVFRDVPPHSHIIGWRFTGGYYLHHQGDVYSCVLLIRFIESLSRVNSTPASYSEVQGLNLGPESGLSVWNFLLLLGLYWRIQVLYFKLGYCRLHHTVSTLVIMLSFSTI